MASIRRALVSPRKPKRANGRRRYEALLNKAEQILARDGADELTIHRLASEAQVPAASIYHFFPKPSAILIGLSERYMSDFSTILSTPIDGIDHLTWQEIVGTLIDRAVTYYSAHPYAQTLLLGADHIPQIRQADFANNRLLAQGVSDLLQSRFLTVPPDELARAVMIGTTLSDAVMTLSILDVGTITPDYGREARIAVCGYLSAKFGEHATLAVD